MCDENILNKIKKLLNMTIENGCSEGEALTALTRARSLMLKHKIAEKDLVNTTEKDIISFELSDYNINIKWIYMLITIFVDNYGVLKYVTKHGKIAKMVLFGLKTDIECVVELIKCAYKFADKNASKVANEHRELFGTAKGIKYSYFYGFVAGLENKYKEQNKQEEYQLMLLVDKDVRSKFNDFTKDFTKVDRVINQKINCSNAYNTGFKDGNNFGTTGISTVSITNGN